MNKRILLIIVSIVVLLLGAGGVLASKKYLTPQKTHYHAGFVVFQNNKKLDFSDFRFMSIEPCLVDKNHDDSDAAIQIEKAHLHDNVGDLVHIERAGAVWKDLFTNINYKLDYSKTTGFINGKQIANYQSQPIKGYDSLVVFIGNNDIAKGLQQAPTKDYIIKMALKSKTCSD